MSAYICIEFIIHYFPGAPTKEEAVYTKKIPDKFCNYALEHRIPRSSAHVILLDREILTPQEGLV